MIKQRTKIVNNFPNVNSKHYVLVYLGVREKELYKAHNTGSLRSFGVANQSQIGSRIKAGNRKLTGF